MNNKKLLIIITTAVLFITSSYSQADIPLYDIDLSISADFSLSGNEIISFTNTSKKNLTQIILQLPLNSDIETDKRTDLARYDYSYPNGFEKSETTIIGAKLNNEIVKFGYISDPNPMIGSAGTRAFAYITAEHGLTPGETATLEVSFVSKIPDKLGNGKHNGVLYLQGMWHPTLAELNASGNFVQDSTRFSQAFYKLKVKSKPNLKVISAGEFKTITENAKEAIRATEVTNPITLLPLYAAENLKKVAGTYKNVTINSYYLPGDETYASASLSTVQKALAYYQDFFNMESQTNYISIVDNYMGSQSAYTAGNTIFIPKELRQYPTLLSRLYEVTLAHEVGHLWWGLTVSYGFDRDNWIGEGLCTFLMNKYFENRYGADYNLLELPKGEQLPNYTFEEVFSYLPYRTLALKKEAPAPATVHKQTNDLSALSTIQYNKGYYIYNILYQELGDKKFIALLQYLVKNYKDKILDTEGLLSAINTVSGKNYSAFFNNWVYHDESFDYEIKNVTSGLNPSLNMTTRVNIKNSGQIAAPLIVQATDKTNKIYINKTLGLNEETIEFITSESIKEIIIDPNKTYPDLNRINNYYPVRYKIKPYVAIPESDAYYMSLRPSVVISNFGSYGTLQLNYGYLDDFNFSLDSNTDYNYWQAAVIKSRVLDPHLAVFSSYNTTSGIQYASIGASYFWNHVQEQITYPGTILSVSYQSEDLYKYVLREKYIQFYGFYNVLDYEKTKHVNKLTFNFTQRYGLTPLNNTYYMLGYEWNNKTLGSDYNFEQCTLDTSSSFRTGHLANINIQTTMKLSNGETPEEKYYYLYSIHDGLKAVSRYSDINVHNQNLALLKTTYTFALAKNIYDTMILTRELWMKDIYLNIFYEWGGLADSVRGLTRAYYNRAAGIQVDINMLTLAQFPFAINLGWSRALPEKKSAKEPIYFSLGINGTF